VSKKGALRAGRNNEEEVIKRSFDILIAGVGLLLTSPVMLMVGLLVRMRLGSPVIFCQQRPGLRGKPFWMYKFRTMTEAQDPNGALLPDEQRLTSLGRFLRTTSLDELPELLNVIKGDMSLVGPRPLLMEYLPLYSAHQNRRHEVRPGITGWAQVNGRNAITWDEKFDLDIWYVDNRSLWIDIKIIFLTFFKIMKREGISQAGQATMEKFHGDHSRE
jgi:lipopolysaccharide/colanic/teichoic acid biosynthesis glycosyltransferase